MTIAEASPGCALGHYMRGGSVQSQHEATIQFWELLLELDAELGNSLWVERELAESEFSRHQEALAAIVLQLPAALSSDAYFICIALRYFLVYLSVIRGDRKTGGSGAQERQDYLWTQHNPNNLQPPLGNQHQPHGREASPLPGARSLCPGSSAAWSLFYSCSPAVAAVRLRSRPISANGPRPRRQPRLHLPSPVVSRPCPRKQLPLMARQQLLRPVTRILVTAHSKLAKISSLVHIVPELARPGATTRDSRDLAAVLTKSLPITIQMPRQ